MHRDMFERLILSADIQFAMKKTQKQTRQVKLSPEMKSLLTINIDSYQYDEAILGEMEYDCE